MTKLKNRVIKKLDPIKARPLSKRVSQSLRHLGLSNSESLCLTNQSNLLKDLLFDERMFLNYLHILKNDFYVNLENIDINRYFPPLRSLDTLCIISARRYHLFNFLLNRVERKYPAITLQHIDDVIQHKSWIDLDFEKKNQIEDSIFDRLPAKVQLILIIIILLINNFIFYDIYSLLK